MMIMPAFKTAFFCALLGACAAWMAEAADFYQVRGGIPNSQYYFQANTVGNQYLFFIGNSVLAGAGLKDPNLRYSAQMVKGFKKHFPEAAIIETRHMQPGGSWFGLFRCSRGQPVFGEVICSGHLAILDFAADDRSADIEQVKTSLEGLVRQIILYRATHSQILVYTLTPEMLAGLSGGQDARVYPGQRTDCRALRHPQSEPGPVRGREDHRRRDFLRRVLRRRRQSDRCRRQDLRRGGREIRRRADDRLSHSRQAPAAHAAPALVPGNGRQRPDRRLRGSAGQAVRQLEAGAGEPDRSLSPSAGLATRSARR